MRTSDVRVWSIRQNKSAKKSTYEVRWVVAGRPFSETRRTKALADSFRAKLLRATREGEDFDSETGLPDFLAPKIEEPPSLTWYAFALQYVAMKWSPSVRATVSRCC
ncbi:hypothetical protein [Streptomyces sp. KLOTTS4A1]|uniref:hypothetical protein n=1 Tax=Streptomyces sp. KLOTTS4A1 TaxID=3390996 RepID=UPI0039F5F5B1